jgi:hypothetical protein
MPCLPWLALFFTALLCAGAVTNFLIFFFFVFLHGGFFPSLVLKGPV